MIWLQLRCSEPTPWRRVVTDALSCVGIGIAEPQTDGSGPGILFFDRPNHDILSVVRDLSRGGIERVLAIAAAGSALIDGFAWSLLEAGASDVFAWEHSDSVPGEIAARLERWQEVDALVASPVVQQQLAGRSSAWIRSVRQVVEVAAFSIGPVLLLGESGTGKELMARLIHALDRRPNKGELVVVDCTTVVPELSGSEFFGHERGAFTGAVAPREGAFALANGGTLFLDESCRSTPSSVWGGTPGSAHNSASYVLRTETCSKTSPTGGSAATSFTELRDACAASPHCGTVLRTSFLWSTTSWWS
jgi:hypothetical protein